MTRPLLYAAAPIDLHRVEQLHARALRIGGSVHKCRDLSLCVLRLPDRLQARQDLNDLAAALGDAERAARSGR